MTEFEIRTQTVVVPACLQRWEKDRKTKKLVLKNYYINLNNYTQWDKYKRNNLKKQFTKEVKDEVLRLPKIKKIHSLKYTLIVPSLRKRDRMNVYSLVDKFFCDALQFHGIIDDDDDDTIGDFNFTKKEYIKGDNTDIRVEVTLYFETI